MKKHLLFLFLLFCCCSLFFYCTDDRWQMQQYVANRNINLTDKAKALLQAYGENFSLLNIYKDTSAATTRTTPDYSTHATPLWEKIRTIFHGSEEYLLIPLQSEQDIYSYIHIEEDRMGTRQFAKSFSRLLLCRKKSRIIARVMTYIPERKYARRNAAVLDTMGIFPKYSKYEGGILVSSLDGTFLHGFYYSNGKMRIKLSPCSHKHTTNTDSLSEAHSSQFNVRLYMSAALPLTRGYDSGDEEDINATYCPACGSTDPEHTCVTIEGSSGGSNSGGDNEDVCPICGENPCVCEKEETPCSLRVHVD